jgi:ubiquinone/menaquinone biosynthesis C-methylase UbiE
MYVDGFTHQLSIDYSPIIIAKMQSKYLDKYNNELNFSLADIRNMAEYKDKSFDIIIDKGTLDAILCGNDSYNNAAEMLSECYRLLDDLGLFICITYGPDHTFIEHTTLHSTLN